MIVTKDSIIGDVLDFNPGTAQFFFAIGMHCLGCPASRGESIADACAVHGTDADELIAKLNAFLSEHSARRKVGALAPTFLYGGYYDDCTTV